MNCIDCGRKLIGYPRPGYVRCRKCSRKINGPYHSHEVWQKIVKRKDKKIEELQNKIKVLSRGK